MEESVLQNRLKVIERQQRFILLLLVGMYVLGSSWLLVSAIAAVTVWHAAIGLTAVVIVSAATGGYRRRQVRE